MNQRSDASSPTVLLRGVMRNLQVKETTSEFFFTAADKTNMGAAGALAAAVGLSGVAAGMASMSLEETHETVTQMNFELDGKQVEALVWMCPFDEGQEVDVVAEKIADRYKAFAVANPKNRTIAMYPHAASGRISHYKSTGIALAKLFFAVVLVCLFLISLSVWLNQAQADWRSFLGILAGGIILTSTIFAVIGVRIAAKYMPFVRIAEGVFRAMGWKDVERINLRKQTLKNKKPGDDPYLGVYYFRY